MRLDFSLVPIFLFNYLILVQEAVRKRRARKIIANKTNAAMISPGVPSSSAIPVVGRAVAVGRCGVAVLVADTTKAVLVGVAVLDTTRAVLVGVAVI